MVAPTDRRERSTEPETMESQCDAQRFDPSRRGTLVRRMQDRALPRWLGEMPVARPRPQLQAIRVTPFLIRVDTFASGIDAPRATALNEVESKTFIAHILTDPRDNRKSSFFNFNLAPRTASCTT